MHALGRQRQGHDGSLNGRTGGIGAKYSSYILGRMPVCHWDEKERMDYSSTELKQAP